MSLKFVFCFVFLFCEEKERNFYQQKKTLISKFLFFVKIRFSSNWFVFHRKVFSPVIVVSTKTKLIFELKLSEDVKLFSTMTGWKKFRIPICRKKRRKNPWEVLEKVFWNPDSNYLPLFVLCSKTAFHQRRSLCNFFSAISSLKFGRCSRLHWLFWMRENETGAGFELLIFRTEAFKTSTTTWALTAGFDRWNCGSVL